MPEQKSANTWGTDLLSDPFDVAFWLTTANQNVLLKQQASLPFGDAVNAYPTITIDPLKTYQPIDGFGFALTGGSAYLISQLSPKDRDKLLRRVFLTDGDGLALVRRI
jgi:glucosylceramidase